MADKDLATFALVYVINVVDFFQANAAVLAWFVENVIPSFVPDFSNGWVVVLGYGTVFSVENHVWYHDVAFEEPERQVEFKEEEDSRFETENISLNLFDDVVLSYEV